MDVRAANLKIIKDIDGMWSVAAAYLDMSINSLHNRVYEVKGQKLATDDSLALQALSKTSHFAEAVAVASGGWFVKMPDYDEVDNQSIQEKFNEVYGEVGALFAEFQTDVKDGKIDPAEQDRLEQIAAVMHRKTEELLSLMFAVYCPRTRTLKMRGVT